MKKNKTELKTKRLVLRPMSDDEIRSLIDETPVEELKAAYTEMLDGCTGHPEERDWYAPWLISLKKGGRSVGDACFKGPQSLGAVEIGYGIDEEFQNQGFCTEAAKALIDWAFSHEDVFFVEAEAEENNAASLRVIEKLGFKRYGMGEEGPRFVTERPATNWLAVYMCLGVSLGSAIGIGTDNMAIGMYIGVAIGVAVGSSMDKQAKDKLENAKKIREKHLFEKNK